MGRGRTLASHAAYSVASVNVFFQHGSSIFFWLKGLAVVGLPHKIASWHLQKA